MDGSRASSTSNTNNERLTATKSSVRLVSKTSCSSARREGSSSQASSSRPSPALSAPSHFKSPNPDVSNSSLRAGSRSDFDYLSDRGSRQSSVTLSTKSSSQKLSHSDELAVNRATNATRNAYHRLTGQYIPRPTPLRQTSPSQVATKLSAAGASRQSTPKQAIDPMTPYSSVSANWPVLSGRTTARAVKSGPRRQFGEDDDVNPRKKNRGRGGKGLPRIMAMASTSAHGRTLQTQHQFRVRVIDANSPGQKFAVAGPGMKPIPVRSARKHRYMSESEEEEDSSEIESPDDQEDDIEVEEDLAVGDEDDEDDFYANEDDHPPLFLNPSSESSSEDGLDVEANDHNEIGPSPNALDPNREAPPNALLQSFRTATLDCPRLQRLKRLPYLPRNVRIGFLARCKSLGINISATPLSSPIRVLYRDALPASPNMPRTTYLTYRASMTILSCPLCDLHGTFHSKDMLNAHFEWDHEEITVTWKSSSDITLTRDTLLLNPSAGLVVESSIPASRNEFSAARNRSETLLSGMDITPAPQREEEEEEEEYQPAILVSKRREERQRSAVPEADMHMTMKIEQLSLDIEDEVPKSYLEQLDKEKLRTTEGRSRMFGDLMIPPEDDPLGPAAQYPYITTSKEGPLYISCRPGGPRLYDILNELPLDQFGVLSWYIIDKEEELFDADDVRDEDKVMQALWSRWIMLNRNRFVSNYRDGAIAFIDEYWEWIHRGAGWAALRVWLLLLLVHRYLTVPDMALALGAYESHTMMDQWYPRAA